MAKLPLNIALSPFIQQRRQILGDRLLGAQGSVEGGDVSLPRVGVSARALTQEGEPLVRRFSGEFRGDPPLAPKPRPDFMDASPLLRGALRPLPRTITTPQPSEPQSMLAKIRSGLGASPNSPVGMAISSGAQSLLEQSGYSPVPRTTGEIVGKALGAAREGYLGGVALEQAEAATIAAQKQQGLENQMANLELLIKASEAESEILKNQAEMGLPFKGTSTFAQASNTLITLGQKIANNTASNTEKSIYSLAYGKLSQPTKITSTDPVTGDITITEIPPQNLTGFPMPEGFKLQTETKPSQKTLKDITKSKDARSMLQNLNEYRRTIMNPDFDKRSQAVGSLGFLGGIQGQAESQAEALRLDLKNLYELGALVGGDFQILDRLLINPNSAKAIASGKDFLIAQLDLLERQLELDMNKRDNQLFGTTSNPLKTDSLEEYNQAPNYLYIELPNGEVVYKTPDKEQ